MLGSDYIIFLSLMMVTMSDQAIVAVRLASLCHSIGERQGTRRTSC